jgi:acyl phosphate:glycerol-3-phosphate acyltransferase
LFSTIIAAILTGYLIGSIPTAYIFVRLSSRRDIRYEGSGNVGALNSFQVTRKKWVGIAVLLLDICKGAAAVVLASRLQDTGYPAQALAGFSAVVGHNFNVWLKFHGGRGLATALGVMLLLGWIFPVVWCLLWFISHRIRRDVQKGNVVATLLAPVSLFFLPARWIELSSWTPVVSQYVTILCAALCILILLRHLDIIRGFFHPGGEQFSSDK